MTSPSYSTLSPEMASRMKPAQAAADARKARIQSSRVIFDQATYGSIKSFKTEDRRHLIPPTSIYSDLERSCDSARTRLMTTVVSKLSELMRFMFNHANLYLPNEGKRYFYDQFRPSRKSTDNEFAIDPLNIDLAPTPEDNLLQLEVMKVYVDMGIAILRGMYTRDQAVLKEAQRKNNQHATASPSSAISSPSNANASPIGRDFNQGHNLNNSQSAYYPEGSPVSFVSTPSASMQPQVPRVLGLELPYASGRSVTRRGGGSDAVAISRILGGVPMGEYLPFPIISSPIYSLSKKKNAEELKKKIEGSSDGKSEKLDEKRAAKETTLLTLKTRIASMVNRLGRFTGKTLDPPKWPVQSQMVMVPLDQYTPKEVNGRREDMMNELKEKCMELFYPSRPRTNGEERKSRKRAISPVRASGVPASSSSSATPTVPMIVNTEVQAAFPVPSPSETVPMEHSAWSSESPVSFASGQSPLAQSPLLEDKFLSNHFLSMEQAGADGVAVFPLDQESPGQYTIYPDPVRLFPGNANRTADDPLEFVEPLDIDKEVGEALTGGLGAQHCGLPEFADEYGAPSIFPPATHGTMESFMPMISPAVSETKEEGVPQKRGRPMSSSASPKRLTLKFKQAIQVSDAMTPVVKFKPPMRVSDTVTPVPNPSDLG